MVEDGGGLESAVGVDSEEIVMGGTIAVITAVLVVNPPFEPEWVWWVLPIVLITPVIFWWNFKILK